jgi:hypothetical protein
LASGSQDSRAGQTAEQETEEATALLRLLAYLWALPVTVIGLCLGLMSVISGGHWQLRGGVVEVTGGLAGWLLRGSRWWRGGAATALGHVILARDQDCLERSNAHERAHVRQFERWGVFLLPAYFLIGQWLALRGYDRHLDHPFEQQAYEQGEGQ